MNVSRDRLQDLFDQAISAHQRGDVAGAERLYQQVLLLEPSAFAPRHMLGVIRFQQGRHDAAIELISAALKQNPAVPDAWINLGHVQSASGRREEAADSYGRALGLAPRNIEALHSRGNSFREFKRFDAALADYDAVLAARPDHAESWTVRGAALSEIERAQ